MMKSTATRSFWEPTRVRVSLAAGAMVVAGFFASPALSQEESPPTTQPSAEQAIDDAERALNEADQRQQADEQRPAQAAEERAPSELSPEAKTPADVMMTHEGTFVRAEGNRFIMTNQGGKQHAHTLDEQASVTLNGEPVSLSQLRPGDKIRVTTPKTELGTAVAVTATRRNTTQEPLAADESKQQQSQADAQVQRPIDPHRGQPANTAQAGGQDRPMSRQKDQQFPEQPSEQQARSAQRDDQQRAALGVLLNESRGGGVLIRDVAPNGAAAQAGIRPGDYVLSIDDQVIRSPQDLVQRIEQKQPGDTVRMRVWRNNREMMVDATLVPQRTLAFRQSQGEPDKQDAAQGQPRDRERSDGPQQGERRGGQAWLGVMLRDDRQRGPGGRFSPDAARTDDQPGAANQERRGAEIANVYPSGPAARAGLRTGDVIIRIDDHEISQLSDIYDVMDQLEPNKEVTITVLRNGEERELKATLGSRDDFFFGGGFSGDEQLRGFREGEELDFDSRFGHFGGMPEYAMMLEQHRHLATQHQRLEDLLTDVLEEVRQLRQEVKQLKGGGAAESAVDAQAEESQFDTNAPEATPPRVDVEPSDSARNAEPQSPQVDDATSDETP